MKEQWKDVVGYKGLYQVSNCGRVRSLDRVVRHRWGGTQLRKGRILSPAPGGRNRPHLRVVLCKGGVRAQTRVHRLVAAAWIGPCPDGQEVCHGAGGQTDNSVSNLRYDTKSSNMLDKRRDGTHSGRPVRRSDGAKFISMQVAAEKTGCNRRGIGKVCQGERKTTGGYGWTYL